MTRVVVTSNGFSVDGAAAGWGPFAHEPDPLAAAARALVGKRCPRMPRLDRPTLAALVAAHRATEGGPRAVTMLVAVEEGSSMADRAYWLTARDRGGLDASPLAFAATLPSAVAGELAMTFGLDGPSLVLAGAGAFETSVQAVPMAEGGPCLFVRLRGWDGAGDGEAAAALVPFGDLPL